MAVSAVDRLYREGLAAIISADQFLHAISIPPDDDGLGLARMHRAHVFLVDLADRDQSSISYIGRIKSGQAHAKVVVLGRAADRPLMRRSFLAGASAYLAEDTSADQLIDVIRHVHISGVWMNDFTARELIACLNHTPEETSTSLLASLSERELQVAKLIAAGNCTVTIARELGIRPKSVRNIVSQLYNKLGTRDRVQTALLVNSILDEREAY